MSDETTRSEAEAQEAPQVSRPARSSFALGLAAGFALGLTGCHAQARAASPAWRVASLSAAEVAALPNLRAPQPFR